MDWFKLNYQNLSLYQLFYFILSLHLLLYHFTQIFLLHLMISMNIFLINFIVIFLVKNHLYSINLFRKLILFIILILGNFNFHNFKVSKNLGNLQFLFIINYQSLVFF